MARAVWWHEPKRHELNFDPVVLKSAFWDLPPVQLSQTTQAQYTNSNHQSNVQNEPKVCSAASDLMPDTPYTTPKESRHCPLHATTPTPWHLFIECYLNLKHYANWNGDGWQFIWEWYQYSSDRTPIKSNWQQSVKLPPKAKPESFSRTSTYLNTLNESSLGRFKVSMLGAHTAWPQVGSLWAE